MLRRQTSRLEYQFVDDIGTVLGTMQQKSTWLPVWVLNATITTALGQYCFRGTGFNHRVEDLATGERVLGTRVGLRLPDHSQVKFLSAHRRRGKRTWQLTDQQSRPVTTVGWLPPVHPWRGRFPLGQATLRPGLEPTPDLVPLIAYLFQLFEDECRPHGGLPLISQFDVRRSDAVVNG
jgi:hypothetical protein